MNPRRFFGGALIWLLIASAGALPPTPIGQWQTMDATGKPRAIVEIVETGGELQGRIVRLFNPSRPNPSCDRCKGERKGQPITGMTILWGVKRQGEGWSDGKILDPENGKVYSVRLTPEDNGARLKLRSYIGLSMLGRTQQWVRPVGSALTP